MNSRNKHRQENQKQNEDFHVEIKKEEKEEQEPAKEAALREEEVEKKKDKTPAEKLQEKLEEKTREAAGNYDQWLRLRAEFENFKKRMQKEKADLIKFGNESLLKAILPTLDNLARAIDHGKTAKDNASLLEGVMITYRQLLNALEKFEVKPMIAEGEVFDPEKHEAVSQAESDLPPNRVLSEIQQGYFFHDRLLRPAKVIVSRDKGEKETEKV